MSDLGLQADKARNGYRFREVPGAGIGSVTTESDTNLRISGLPRTISKTRGTAIDSQQPLEENLIEFATSGTSERIAHLVRHRPWPSGSFSMGGQHERQCSQPSQRERP